MLLLHGFMGDRRDLAPLQAAISQHFDCVALDLPGHGASDRVSVDDPDAGAPSRLEEMASAVLALLVALGVPRRAWAIAGHSLGGAVALIVIYAPPRVFASEQVVGGVGLGTLRLSTAYPRPTTSYLYLLLPH